MKHISILSVFLAATSLSSASAQEHHTQIDEKAAAAFEKIIKEYDIPGLVVGVTRGGQHSFYQTGLASREHNRPVTPDTLFELASVSKIFNFTLAALAEERGTSFCWMPPPRLICLP